MRTTSRDKNKLIPLRKFANSRVYSTAYLSQLVQRKKLKAEKIGRNFYTTENWFKEYIDRHARDGKQAEYKRSLKYEARIINLLSYKAIAVIMAIVFILASIFIYFDAKDSGQIAGVEERQGTSTKASN